MIARRRKYFEDSDESNIMAKVPPPRGKGYPPPADSTIGNLDKPESEALVPLNFKVPGSFRKDFNITAAQRGKDKGCIVAHLRGKWTEEMPYALLTLHIHVEVPNHHYTAVGADALLATTKLARLHVAFHDIHAVFLFEGHTGDFIEADDVVLAYQSPLPIGIVDEHTRNCGLTTGDEVSIG